MPSIIAGRSRRPSLPGAVPLAGLWVVILAAGASRRFGRAKLLQRFGPESLLQHAARVGRAVAGPRCLVVLGARASRMAVELRGTGVRCIANRRWHEGMSTSLAAGIAALPREATSALVLLADQFAVETADLARLVRASRRHPEAIIASGWDGIRGAPAVLPRHAFARARRLKGDAGARELLRDPATQVQVVPVPAARYDLDEPSDWPRDCGSARSLGAARNQHGRARDAR